MSSQDNKQTGISILNERLDDQVSNEDETIKIIMKRLDGLKKAGMKEEQIQSFIDDPKKMNELKEIYLQNHPKDKDKKKKKKKDVNVLDRIDTRIENVNGRLDDIEMILEDFNRPRAWREILIPALIAIIPACVSIYLHHRLNKEG